MSLPVNIADLLSGNIVEGERMEFKQGWNPAPIMRTVCAFANDFENLGSGYIIVGVEEQDGLPVRPVYGFPSASFEKVQLEMQSYGNLLRPAYFPRLSLEEIDGKHVLVIWVPAGSHRPYRVPREIKAKHKDYQYYIRQYSSTVIPNPQQEEELVQLTAHVPFDDRVNSRSTINELNPALMREHLRQTGSRLYDENLDTPTLARQMNLAEGADEHLFPKNVGLLMFSDNPQRYFKGAQIDIVEFPEGVDAPQFNEKTFRGPVQQQLRDALSYLQTNIIKEKVIKHSDRAEADRVFNYPYDALEEALANAVYHRNYELYEPIEIRVLPDRIEIISYGGANPSLRPNDFNQGVVRIRRYRNRRIGEFLKELRLTEGRGTGIPTMRRTLATNGSPEPKFDTDEDERRYFVTEIFIHPAFLEKSNQVSNQVDTTEKEKEHWQVFPPINDKQYDVLAYCRTPRSRGEILEQLLGLSNQTKNYRNNVALLLEIRLLEHTIPDKPNSQHQRYRTTKMGEQLLHDRPHNSTS